MTLTMSVLLGSVLAIACFARVAELAGRRPRRSSAKVAEAQAAPAASTASLR